ncbi:MAG: STAS/SEC14 domain-containing protein [Rhodomicrobium sp.]
MFKLIEGLPQDVLGIEATGKVTHADYATILIPAAEAMMAKGPVKMFYVAGEGFEGYELEALWDDGAFGVKHWHDFSHIAVAADQLWLRAAITMFKPFFPGEVRLFKLSELPEATRWISNPETGNP